MTPDALNALLSELETARAPYLKGIEGFQHQLEQRDLRLETRNEVTALLAEYTRDDAFLARLAQEALRTRNTMAELLNTGYPRLPARTINRAAYDDLNQNREAINFAFGQFELEAITTDGEAIVSEQEAVP